MAGSRRARAQYLGGQSDELFVNLTMPSCRCHGRGPQRPGLQAATVLPRGDADEHLLDDATIQRIGVGERLERRQCDLFALGPDAGPTNLHFAPAEDDFTRGRPSARGRTRRLMLVPRAADGRSIP